MTLPVVIIAQATSVDRFQSFLDGLQTAMHPNEVGPPAIMMTLAFVTAVVAVILLLALLHQRRQRAEASPLAGRPMRLFSQALKHLDVSLADRLLMRFVARKSQLPHPTVMLLSPALLERYTATCVDALPLSTLRRHLRTRLKTVAAKAFG
jgi:hypothetical protein